MVVTTDDTEVLPVDKISRDSGMVGTRNSDSMSCDHQKTRWKKPASLVTLASAIIRPTARNVYTLWILYLAERCFKPVIYKRVVD